MSAKWRALQHRHRYTYSAIVFPQYYKQSLNDFINLSVSQDHDASTRVFYSQLNELVSLKSTYAQLSHAKKLASAFTELLKISNEIVVSQASRFYLEILFLENSVPLHRTLVSVLAKTRDFQSVIGDCFRSLCEEYADLNGNGNEKRKRFCVSRVGLSMMSSPKLGYLVEVVEECAILMSLDVVSSLKSVVLETNDWCRPSPIVMEQCQEALSCTYYLLQRCPSRFTSLIGLHDSNIMETILTTILSILKSEAFSRDCFVAAGVSFCAALQVCLCPEELGLSLMEGIFHHSLNPSNTFQTVVMKIPYKGNLFSEIQSFSLLSRLCLIRGILTSIPRTLLDIPFECGSKDCETILYNGILPELCKYCENPTDSHFNFHALTVMQICLQQIKTLIQTTYIDDAKNHNPISDDIGARVLRIIWNNLEDPLSQTVKQVHLIFDIYLDIQSSLPSTNGKDKIQLFLRKIASNLLRMGGRCKGRYVPLASLTKRLGAKRILEMNPDMMFETAWAYVDDDVCCASTTFLKCFLASLRDEFWSSDGVEIGSRNYRNALLPPFLHGLASGNSKLRSNLNTYAFPVILEVDVDSIFSMLSFISIGEDTLLSFTDSNMNLNLTVEQKVAVLVSLLKVSRSLALIEGDIDRFESSEANTDSEYALVCVKGIKVKVLVNWLTLALTHVDESLRTDAVESLFLNPKTASLPSSLELSMMKEAMPLNMRCSSTSFQMKLTSLFRKFFSRVKTALERQIKQGTWKPNNGNILYKEEKDSNFKKAEELFHFMKWLSTFLFFSCYPSAPYERKIMAMELILIMNNTWPILQKHPSETITPYDAKFTSPESTLLLVGSIVDSWDRLRENSFRILLNFPTPLPGILTTEKVKDVIIWAKKLVYSPRVRESDAGSLTMRLIFRKYVLDLGWIVNTSSNVVMSSSSSSSSDDDSKTCFNSPVVEYVTCLIDWLQSAVEMGEHDLSDACKNSFVHGILLTLRYGFEELDWSCDNVYGMKCAFEKLLELIMRITSMALSVVSADAWHIPADMDEDDLVDVDDDSYMWGEGNADVDVRRSAGIPAAFIAFFLSEPEGTPKRLLPRALRWLIDLSNKSITNQNESGSGSGSKSDPKIRDEGVIPTVHAFNVLKAAFNDTNLATDTSGFSAEAMIICIRSFSSNYWEVRNSACLAYTALVRRMIGFLNVQKRESARRALTGLEFFHRYPSLHPFLYSELKIATELLTTGSRDLAQAVHPSLCPMLILLSRLKPSTIASESGDELDPFLFTPFIRKCSTQSNLRVRVLASRALTGLISNEKLPLILVNTVNDLPPSTTKTNPPVSSNTIHGLLLQLISLLDINCRNLIDSDKKDQILDELVETLVTRSSIAYPETRPTCPTLVTSFLRVLDIMLSIAKTYDGSKSFGKIRDLLSDLSSRSLDMEASFGLPYFDPTISECRKQAATSYFNSIQHESQIQDRLIRCFSDPSYEVRIATFKWLLLFLKTSESNSGSGVLIEWMNLHLHTEMVNLLSLERNHKCVYYILKILFAFHKSSPESRFPGITDSDSVLLFWEKLVSLYKLTRHMKTRETILCCMAVCVKQFANMFMRNNHEVYDSISYYVDLVKLHSNASEPVNIRKAVSESIIASGLLQTVDFIGQHVDFDRDLDTSIINMYASRTLDLWSVCIKLLEDEDASLRSKLATDVQKCFTSETYGIPSQVDKVIISSFEYLTSVFGQWVDYFDYLCDWVLSGSENVVSRGDLVRRVFDKEIDNHHEEKLLICQICCLHLEKLPVSGGLDLLYEWRRRFLRRFMVVSGDLGGKQAVKWIGGLGNHKDAFLPVYSNLLGVYALSRCIFKSKSNNIGSVSDSNSNSDSGSGLLEMADLKDAIKPFLGNPLICNLFLSVVRLHEESLGENAGCLTSELTGDEVGWDRFDPYFLLR